MNKPIYGDESENLVEFYIHDTENKTIEKIVCTKELAQLLDQLYEEKK